MLAIVTWLSLHGCGIPCASGILANFVTEVGPALDPCTVGPSGSGLPQWAGVRRRRMLATLGQGWCNIEAQLGFVWTELREMHLIDRLLRAADPGFAAEMFMIEFEQPRNRNTRQRRDRAWAIYRELQAGAAR